MVFARTFVAAALASAALLATGEVAAQHMPAMDTGEGHRFFSIPQDTQAGYRIYYEACNESAGGSTFFWDGAGFGVNAWHPLASGACAYKRVWADRGDIAVVAGNVEFYRGVSSAIPTWSYARGDDAFSRFRRMVSNVRARMEEPERFIEAGEIETIVDRSDDGVLRLSIKAARPLLDIVVVLPEAALEMAGLQERVKVVSGSGVVEVGSAGSLMQPASSAPGEASSRRVEEHMVALLLRNPDRIPAAMELEIEAPDDLGGEMWVFGAVDGVAALRDELPLMAEPR